MSKRRTEKPGEEAGSQEPVVQEPEVATRTLMELLVQKAQQEQQKAQQEQQMEQQRMLLALIEQQKEELAQHRREMAELKAQRAAPTEEGDKKATVRLPKPTLQKLGPEDDIEHFLATFERIAKQQGWPVEMWPTQLAGLLTGKAMAAYASLTSESAASYNDRCKEGDPTSFTIYMRRHTAIDSGQTGRNLRSPTRIWVIASLNTSHGGLRTGKSHWSWTNSFARRAPSMAEREKARIPAAGSAAGR